MPEAALSRGEEAAAGPPGAAAQLWSRGVAEPHAGYALRGCLDCGICTASCLAALHGGFSPFAMVQHLGFGGDPGIEASLRTGVWDCVLCNACSAGCPTGTDPARLVVMLREQQVRSGQPLARGAADALASMSSLLDTGSDPEQRDRKRQCLAELAQIWQSTGVIDGLRTVDATLAGKLSILTTGGGLSPASSAGDTA